MNPRNMNIKEEKNIFKAISDLIYISVEPLIDLYLGMVTKIKILILNWFAENQVDMEAESVFNASI